MRHSPILYSFRRCPYAMRARMALLMSGTIYEHREVLLRDKPAAMLAASPKGTVPVLVLVDGTVVDESIDIMDWALSQHDPEDWLPRAEAALVAKFDGAFKHHLDRYKYAGRYEVDPLTHRAAGLAMLAELDERLKDRDYLDGATRGFSDIALFPFVRQFAGVEGQWFAAHAPMRVREWLATLVASELFEQAMVRTAPWEGGQS
ncbi:MAG: glutathione S-transferase [Sphingopyxis sp.]|nr:glutathione S-transferase [Sphingopyxis sp.]